MKKMCKGFTLVELLIVVAILATLTAVMTATLTGQTAKAKAATIAANVEACKKAAQLYYSANWDNFTTMAAAKTSDVIKAYVPTFEDFSRTDGAIKYTPDDTDGIGVDATIGMPKWNMTVSFASDGEAAAIKTELAKIPGYGNYKAAGEDTATDKLDGNQFKVTLYSGKIEKVTTATTGG